MENGKSTGVSIAFPLNTEQGVAFLSELLKHASPLARRTLADHTLMEVIRSLPHETLVMAATERILDKVITEKSGELSAAMAEAVEVDQATTDRIRLAVAEQSENLAATLLSRAKDVIGKNLERSLFSEKGLLAERAEAIILEELRNFASQYFAERAENLGKHVERILAGASPE